MGQNQSRKEITEDNGMLSEYDFTEKKGVRGKYYQAYRYGHTVKIYEEDGAVSVHYFTSEEGSVMLDPDIRRYFPDSETVNNALRSLIALIPEKKVKKDFINHHKSNVKKSDP